jgi:hypothetical protein
MEKEERSSIACWEGSSVFFFVWAQSEARPCKLIQHISFGFLSKNSRIHSWRQLFGNSSIIIVPGDHSLDTTVRFRLRSFKLMCTWRLRGLEHSLSGYFPNFLT